MMIIVKLYAASCGSARDLNKDQSNSRKRNVIEVCSDFKLYVQEIAFSLFFDATVDQCGE